MIRGGAVGPALQDAPLWGGVGCWSCLECTASLRPDRWAQTSSGPQQAWLGRGARGKHRTGYQLLSRTKESSSGNQGHGRQRSDLPG